MKIGSFFENIFFETHDFVDFFRKTYDFGTFLILTKALKKFNEKIVSLFFIRNGNFRGVGTGAFFIVSISRNPILICHF